MITAKRAPVASRFAKGDKVKVTVFYFDDEGFSYAHAEKVSVV